MVQARGEFRLPLDTAVIAAWETWFLLGYWMDSFRRLKREDVKIALERDLLESLEIVKSLLNEGAQHGEKRMPTTAGIHVSVSMFLEDLQSSPEWEMISTEESPTNSS